MMLPSQKTELAIYKYIKRLGSGAVATSLPMLSQATGQDQTVVVERLKALEADNRILLSKYSGGSPWPRAQFEGNDAKFFYMDSFRIEIAPQGRRYFEELEQLAEATGASAFAAIPSAPLVFVSCGQSTPTERELGEAVARLVEQETGCRSYFAQNQTTFDGVTENVLKALYGPLASSRSCTRVAMFQTPITQRRRHGYAAPSGLNKRLRSLRSSRRLYNFQLPTNDGRIHRFPPGPNRPDRRDLLSSHKPRVSRA
jgi:hypothetical protein